MSKNVFFSKNKLGLAILMAFAGHAFANPPLTKLSFASGAGYTTYNNGRYAVRTDYSATDYPMLLQKADGSPATCDEIDLAIMTMAYEGPTQFTNFDMVRNGQTGSNCRYSLSNPSQAALSAPERVTLIQPSMSVDYLNPIFYVNDTSLRYLEVTTAYGERYFGAMTSTPDYHLAGSYISNASNENVFVGKYLGKKTVAGYGTVQDVVNFGSVKIPSSAPAGVLSLNIRTSDGDVIYNSAVTRGQTIPLDMVVNASANHAAYRIKDLHIDMHDGSGPVFSKTLRIANPTRNGQVNISVTEDGTYRYMNLELGDPAASMTYTPQVTGNDQAQTWVVKVTEKATGAVVRESSFFSDGSGNKTITLSRFTNAEWESYVGKKLVVNVNAIFPSDHIPFANTGFGQDPLIPDNQYTSEHAVTLNNPYFEFKNPIGFKDPQGDYSAVNDAALGMVGLLKSNGVYYNAPLGSTYLTVLGQNTPVVKVGTIKIIAGPGIADGSYSMSAAAPSDVILRRTNNGQVVSGTISGLSAGETVDVYIPRNDGNAWEKRALSFSIGGLVSGVYSDLVQNKQINYVVPPRHKAGNFNYRPFEAGSEASPAIISFDFGYVDSSNAFTTCCDNLSGEWEYTLSEATMGVLSTGKLPASSSAAATVLSVDASNLGTRTNGNMIGKTVVLTVGPVIPPEFTGWPNWANQQDFTIAAIAPLEVTPLGGSVLYNPSEANIDLLSTASQNYSIKIPLDLGVSNLGKVVVSGDVGGIPINTLDISTPENTNLSLGVVFPPSTKAWDTANIHLGVYDELGAVVGTKERSALVLPEFSSTYITFTDFKSTYSTGSTFSVSGSVGFDTGFNQKVGQYNVGLYEKTGSTYTLVSDEVVTDENTGNFVINNLSANQLAGKQIVAKGSPVTPSDYDFSSVTLPTLESSVKSFSIGSLTGGTVAAASNECNLPCLTKLSLSQSTAQAAATQSIQWQYRELGVDLPPSVMPGTAASTNFAPTKGGTYEVFAVLTEKTTGNKVTTSAVTITIHEPPKVTLAALDVALPGQTINVSATVLTPSGKPATIDSELGYLAVLEVYKGNDVTPMATYQGVTSLSFNPLGYFAGVNSVSPEANLTNDQYRLVYKVRPAWLIDDAKSLTVVEKVVSFGVSAPVVDVKTPPAIESGKPVTLSATVTPSWGAAKTNLKTITIWSANDAVIGTGNKVTFTPPISENPSSTAHPVEVIVYSYVEGAEEATAVTKIINLSVYDYLMPQFSVKPAIDSGYAPANLRLTVSPINTTEAKKMSGKKYTYSWSIPEGFAGTAKGSTLFGRADLPGSYPISVTVTDNLQNSITLDYTLTLEQMKPYVFSLVAKPGLAFERAPMTYFLRPTITGGHPKDRIKLATLTVDGQVIGTPTSKLPGVISGLEAGSHEIKIDFESNLGQTASSTVTVNVAENQPPIVTLLAKPITRSTSYIVLPSYKDTDGKIRKVEWFIDGEPTGKSGSSMMIDMKTRSDTTVSIKITDDSGASTEASVVVPGGNGGTASAR